MDFVDFVGLLVCCEKELEDMDFVDFSVTVVNV